MSGGYALEPADLDAIVGFLDDAKSELGDGASSLPVTPDAGRSTDEVVKGFEVLSVAARALSEAIGGISTALADNVARYREAEERTEGSFREHGAQR